MKASRPTDAFAMTLAGGVLVVAGALIMMIKPRTPHHALVSLLGFVPGIIVLVSAYLVHSGAARRVRAGGILAVLFGALSIIVGGGFLIGAVLCVIGGVLALIWKPTQKQSP